MTNSNSSKVSNWRRIRRISIRAILILTLFLGIFLTYISNTAVKEARSVDHLLSKKVKGTVQEFGPNELAKFTPKFAQYLLGEKYFRTVQSASLSIYLDPKQRNAYHREQVPQLAIDSVSNFKNAKYLDLRIEGNGQQESLDYSPLGQLENLNQLGLGRANEKEIQKLVKYSKVRKLELTGCKILPETAQAISNNRYVESISFNMCEISAESFSHIADIRSIHFFGCVPVPNPDGSYSFKPDPPYGGLIRPNDRQIREQSNKAFLWLTKEIPGVSISGLQSLNQSQKFVNSKAETSLKFLLENEQRKTDFIPKLNQNFFNSKNPN